MKNVVSPVAELSFDETHSTLYMKMLEGAVLNLKNAKQHGLIIEELTQNKPYLALIDTTNFFTIDDDVIKFAAIPHKLPSRKAAAYYNPGLANWFTIEVFRKIGNPVFPVQVFRTKPQAIAWLNEQKHLIAKNN